MRSGQEEINVEVISPRYPEYRGFKGVVECVGMSPCGGIISIHLNIGYKTILLNFSRGDRGVGRSIKEILKKHLIEIDGEYYYVKALQEPWTLIDMGFGC